MKTTLSIALLYIASSCGVCYAGENMGCKDASWSPELHTFYGAKDVIQKKLEALDVNLNRRVFLQVTEGDGKAEVKFFERTDNGKYNVYIWTGKDVGQITTLLDKTIFENKGVNCVGEQVKAVLKKQFPDLKVIETVAAPESPKAAFSHSVKEAEGEFIKTAIYILC